MTSSVTGDSGTTPVQVTFVETGHTSKTEEQKAGKLSEHDVTADPAPHSDGIRKHEGLQGSIQLTVEAVGAKDASESPPLRDSVAVDNISFEVREAEVSAAEGRPTISFEAVPAANDLPNSIQVKVEQGESQPLEKGRVSSLMEEQRKKGAGRKNQDVFKYLGMINKVLDNLESWNRSHYGG